MLKKLVLIGVAVPLLLTTIISCNRNTLPPDVPEIAPCVITILKGGKPISDATVSLSRTENHGGWTVYGLTNSSGVAQIITAAGNATARGAPIGDYTVTVQKEPPRPEGDKTPEEIRQMGREELGAYQEKLRAKRDALPREVPNIFYNNTTTPVTLKVEPKTGATVTVELNDYLK